MQVAMRCFFEISRPHLAKIAKLFIERQISFSVMGVCGCYSGVGNILLGQSSNSFQLKFVFVNDACLRQKGV